MGNDRASTDNRVITNRHPFADGRAVADPNIGSEGYWAGATNGLSAVVNVVPVGVCQIGAGSDHATFTDGYFARGIDANTRAEQHKVANLDIPLVIVHRPCGQAHGAVPGSDDMHAFTEFNVATVEL